MPDRRQFEGKDLRDALRAASSALGIPEDRLSYGMLASSRKGLFGIGARVRIWAEPSADAPGGAGETALERSFAAAEAAFDDRSRRIAPKAVSPPSAGPAQGSVPSQASLEDVEWVRRTLARIVELMAFDLRVAARPDVDGVAVELSGPDRDRLVEEDGELLEALQFLLNRMARRKRTGAGRVRLECEGFRHERDQDLINLARETAQQVSLSGRSRWLPPLNPYERRLVHLTVREIPGVATESAGDGFLKRVRITPTKSAGEA